MYNALNLSNYTKKGFMRKPVSRVCHLVNLIEYLEEVDKLFVITPPPPPIPKKIVTGKEVNAVVLSFIIPTFL